MPTSEVILTENIRGLGAEADIVKVKRGFARNFLLPQGKAYEVTPVTLKRINQLKTKRAQREGEERNAAEELARKINKLTLQMSLETGATECFLPARKLYEKFGFDCCEPFADYRPDPYSVFMTRTL